MVHHYGEIHFRVQEFTDESARVVLTNAVTGAEIEVVLPRRGAFLDPEKILTEADAANVGNQISHLLRDVLD